jgi:ribonuclease HII
VLGIDEAGRGPVIGSMILGGVLDTENSSITYSEMGCKDSKMVAPKKREELNEKIRKTAKEARTVEVTASQIDFLRASISLNEIEAKKIGELVQSFDEKPDKVIVDCPDTQPKKFERRLHKYLGTDYEFVIEHKADVKYPIVSAASIIAKVERDRLIKQLEKRYGPLGNGYPHDELTIKFLKDYFAENKKFPSIVRKSWMTAKTMKEMHLQKKLGDFE